ncbi:calcium-binding protein [Herbaspirillum sp. alder98]|uniref:calcium-binding protein n=1 Tax=Herbaspirillum sp. alder98 TaxID=2913096 RepID=UPI001CD836CF|nr:calcium-binding protein [Herbaspirillum sp. alder98]MCA1323194.1 calcium-binding protein [Herbaspirillum sp. alder98]
MSDDEQSLVQHSAVEDDSLEDDMLDDPQMDRPQSQAQIVLRQVQLSGPMGTMDGRKHLLNAEQGKFNYLIGSEQGDEIYGGELDDMMMGQGGNDMLSGHGGNDILLGEEGMDGLRGGDGDDTLDSGDGADTLEGERGNDVLMGGAGVDVLLGGEGHDVLIGGAGNDSLCGQEGDDIYRFDKGDGQDVIWNADESSSASPGVNYHDRIEYGSGIGRDQLWFQSSEHDLLVTNIETGDSQRVKQWYEGEGYRIDEFCLDDGSTLSGDHVESLVAAMAALPMPAIGTPHFSTSYLATLNPTLAQSWK